MPKTAKPKPFATEAALCARFLAAVPPEWTAYAETAGWDILLVRNADGFQIGIQAKLKLNAHVVAQTIEEGHSHSAESAGPDCRAVLVPEDDAGPFDVIAGYVGFTIVRVRAPGGIAARAAFRPPLPSARDMWGERWFECAPAKRHVLPEYVPDVVAGSSAPVQLTKWKISAIKIAVTLERRGFLTRADFKHHGIDYRRFIARDFGWLTVQDGHYVRGPSFPDFKRQHPRAYGEIAADHIKWMLPAAKLVTKPTQHRML